MIERPQLSLVPNEGPPKDELLSVERSILLGMMELMMDEVKKHPHLLRTNPDQAFEEAVTSFLEKMSELSIVAMEVTAERLKIPLGG